MDGDHGLSDLRFDGYNNDGLAQQVDGLRDGPGSEGLHDAMSALMTIGYSLAVTDVTLREQLAEIGVTWQGQAADGGTAATEAASIYAEDAIEPVTDSAQGVGSQGESFSNTRNGAPDSETLRGPTEQNGFDQFAGMLGHTTDHAQDVKATNAAREQAVDSMTGYQNSSSDALNRSRALPVPPGMNLVAQPVDNQIGVTNVSGFSSGGAPSTAGAGSGGGPHNAALPPGGSPPPSAGPPGGPTPPGPGPTPGLPPGGGPPTTPGGLPPGLRPAMNPLLMADAATMLGASTAGGAGAGAERDRVGRGARPPGAPLKNGVPIGSAPADDARAARNAERYGAKTGRPAGSIMQPAAAGGRTADGEEDKEHVRRYGIDSADVFEDDRVVAPESIGDEDE